MTDLLDYMGGEPYGGPGAKTDSTDREAGDAIAAAAPRLRGLTLEHIEARGRYGATPEELVAITGIPREALQPRCSELKVLGEIVDSGERRLNRSGKRAQVLVARRFAPDRECEA